MDDTCVVLLVDSRGQKVQGLLTILKASGLTVRTVSTIQEAAREVHKSPSIELLIITLPAASDPAEKRELQQLLEIRAVAVVFMLPEEGTAGLESLQGIPRYGVVRSNDSELVPEIIREALRLFRSHRETERAKNTYQLLYDTEDDAVLMIDETSNSIIEANRAAEGMYGYSQDTLIGMKVWQLSAQPEQSRTRIAALQTQNHMQVDSFHRRQDGSEFPVHITATRTQLHGQSINIATIRDLTAQKQVEQELREREWEYKELIDTVPSAIIKYDNEQKIFFFNRYAEKMFGYSADEVMGKLAVETTNPEIDSQGQNHREMFTRLLRDPDCYAYHENENLRKDGTRLWVAWRNAALYDTEGNRIGMLSIGNDSTQRKEIEESRQQLLEEKDILLSEVHHRIKNDMHVLSSLLSLQASASTSEVETASLQEAENRIQLMRSIYDKLYMQKNFRAIELGPFLRDLLEELQQNYCSASGINMQSHIEEFMIPVKFSFPLGLIINELLSNAFKYAFPHNQGGTLLVQVNRCSPDAGNCIETLVSDNGEGLPSEVASKEQLGFGLSIVDAMVEQYHGKWEIENTAGTLHRICLPLPE